MKRKTLAGMAIAAVSAGVGLALALSGSIASAQAGRGFGPVAFHQAPAERKIVVDPQQVREHPGEPFAVWTGFSTYPDFTPAQRRDIEDALNSAKGGNGGGHGPGGGSSSGGGGSSSGGGGGSSSTVPYWEHSITSGLDGQNYTMSMVGPNPYDSGTWTSANSSVTYVPIVLKITINNVTYDPTQPACDDSIPVQDRFFSSPIFNDGGYSLNGTPVTDQFTGAFQRANFWSEVGTSADAVARLSASGAPTVVSISLKGRNHTLTCAANGHTIHVGEINLNTFDSAIQSVIAQLNVQPNQLPVVLTSNIVESYNGQCCVLGYHNAVPVSGGVLTYATGAYIDSGVFTNVDDVAIWSHEIGEWLDDPFVQASVAGGGSDDLTPPWGNIGQVSGCQNNLEVGDPLTGTQVNTGVFNGFIYHLQDLAYKDWFYRTPADSPDGNFSFFGTFKTAAPSC